MSRQVRRVAAGMFVLFLALFVNLNYLHVLRADELSNDPANLRGLIREYEIRRGLILAGRGASSRPIADVAETDGRLRHQRLYPDGPLYAPITGYYSFIYGRSQLENTFNEFLVGSAPETFARNLGDLLAGRQRVGDNVVTTIRPGVQAAARAALDDRVGAVVALDPTTGEVLALWSSPTYDPNVLASHDPAVVREAWEQLTAHPENPLRSNATQEVYPPGSTFKIVTAAAALENGVVTPESRFPDPVRLELPQTASASIGNFGGGTCNGGEPIDLRQAFAVSCNTTFAQLGLDLRAERLVAQAEAFGLNTYSEFQLPLEESRIPKELDQPSTAQSAIGQRDVRVTPLQVAMISAAVANDGVLMRPRVVREVQDFAGRIIAQYPPEPLDLPGSAQPISAQTAETLTQLMTGVVENGSGRAAAIPGVTVAGKTGTAQTGEDRAPTVWFTGFAPAEAPRVAVAVVVEEGGGVGDEATGGQVAAPIARAVIEAALAETEA